MLDWAIRNPQSAIVRLSNSPPQYAIRHTPYAIRHTPYAIRNTLYAIRNTPYAIRNTQYAIRNTQYANIFKTELICIAISG